MANRSQEEYAIAWMTAAGSAGTMAETGPFPWHLSGVEDAV
jgi:hypothetical protein